MEYLVLNSKSAETAHDILSVIETSFDGNIGRCCHQAKNTSELFWKSLIRPLGDSMNTFDTFTASHRIFSCAAGISARCTENIELFPDVLDKTHSNKAPRYCIAMSLNANVGPLDNLKNADFFVKPD